MIVRTHRTALMTFALAACLAIVQQAAAGAAETRAAGVDVTVKYTGKGSVDETHRLWIWLFDSPDIAPGSIPVAELSLEKNGDVASFTNVAAPQVWIAIAYDEKGGFGGSAPPPSGSPVTLYMDASGPAAVTPGDKTAVTVTFDDSQRMP
jgi:hypothetical protein